MTNPTTPIYGLPYENDDSQPLSSISGGSSGTEAILAQAVEDELARIDDAVADAEGDLSSVHDPIDVAEVTTTPQALLQLVVPSGLTAVRVIGWARTNESAIRTGLRVGVNSADQAGAFNRRRWSWSGTSTSPSVTAADESDAWNLGTILAGANAHSAQVGEVEIVFPTVQGSRLRMRAHASVFATDTASEQVRTVTIGRTTSTVPGPITSIQLSPSAGSFVAGTRFELRHI
jgi:hypothetical protein